MNDQENLTSRLVEVARLYYLEEKSQQEIADILQVSRSLIALYLKKAKDQGIVKFLIVNPEDQFQDLSNIITEKMGLRHVKIVPTENKSHEFTRNLLADYAASYLDSIISDGDIIGLDWGRSVQAVVSKLNPVRPRKLLFIPLLGEAGSHNMVTRINQTVLEAARAYKSEATFLHAPVISDTKFVRDALLQNTASRNTIENWPKITIACTGIGAFPPQEGQFVIIEDEIEKELVKKNIVGNICTYYFDQAGSLQFFPIYERLVRIPIENLKHCAHIIAVAEGEKKAYATFGAIKAGLITDLFIDEAIGRILVSLIR